MQPKIIVKNSKQELIRYFIEQWLIQQNLAIQNHAFFLVALSGGKTPLPFYHELSKSTQKIEWQKTAIYMVDERFVTLEHPDSNYSKIYETLINNIEIPSNNLHPIQINSNSITATATKYHNTLSLLTGKRSQIPQFDLITLGIGNDGHTASLFSDSTAITITDKLATTSASKNASHQRITMTLPILNNAKAIVFIITGKEKAKIAKQVIVEKKIEYPATRINPKSGNLQYLLDKEAAYYL